MLTCNERSDAEQSASSCNENIFVDKKVARLRLLVRYSTPLLILGLPLLLPFTGHSPELTIGAWGNSTSLSEDKGWNVRAVEVAECIFDVNLASSSLAYAGATISHASHQCPKEEAEIGATPSEDCSLATTEIFSIFASIASFLSSGISKCPVLKTNEMAMCSASISKLLASLSEVGIAGKLISEACTEDEGNKFVILPLEFAVEAETPSVEHAEAAGHVAEGSEEVHESEHAAQKDKEALGITECTIKAASAIFFLGKAGSDIVEAAHNCPKEEEGHEGGSDLDCSVNVEKAIGALGTVANTLATVAMDCAQSVNIKARCALDVTKLITALVEVAASATGTHVECVAKSNETGEHVGEAEHRRLRN
mmetsp:Transcript_110635/g.214233  ORF Transcript_110635/g.214233 Transcript_110635/m.214233 type:complete len:367 (+) Transcript_110635:80-1180(+)